MGISYVPTTWVNGETQLNADNLNHIEQGINRAGAGQPDILIGNQDYDPAAVSFRWGDADFKTKWTNAVSGYWLRYASDKKGGLHIKFAPGKYDFSGTNGLIIPQVTSYPTGGVYSPLIISGSDKEAIFYNQNPITNRSWDNNFAFISFGTGTDSAPGMPYTGSDSGKVIIKDLILSCKPNTSTWAPQGCDFGIALTCELTVDNCEILGGSSSNNYQICGIWYGGRNLTVTNSLISGWASASQATYAADVFCRGCEDVNINNNVIGSINAGMTDYADFPHGAKESYGSSVYMSGADSLIQQPGGALIRINNNKLTSVSLQARCIVNSNFIYGGNFVVNNVHSVSNNIIKNGGNLYIRGSGSFIGNTVINQSGPMTISFSNSSDNIVVGNIFPVSASLPTDVTQAANQFIYI